ncbi:MAG TPA: pyruvate dehydrogenase complex dihydrolipoamide acetyltransferase [Opitutus sp.]|nr:pyruvate dehydrogenase complex dihydrolipoamide acetyltransferase [Opitutus sp.]
MAEIIDMPKLSDTMTVGTLVKWLKKEGDPVKTGDMLAEVETDKATMELESFFDGTLLKIFAANGAQVAIGEPLCAIGKPGETVDAPAHKPAPAAPTAEPAPADKGKPAAATNAKNEAQSRPAPVGQVSDLPHPAAPAPAPAQPTPPSTSSGRIKISPLARKLAAEKNIDPSRVHGSGPGGRIVRADILAAEKSGASGAAAPSSRLAGSGRTGPIQDDRIVPASNMRATIAKRLVEAKTTIPHFYLEIEVDAAPMLELRAQLNTALEAEGVKLSVNDFILKAAAEALRQVPAANASWEGAGIHYHGAAHVSFAVAIEDGLITPVVRDTHAKSIFQVSTEARSLGKLAKDKKLKPEQFTGGTFCVSNLGMMGIDRFSAVINPPNAAILAVGATVKKPVVKDDRIVVGQRVSLTLSCDHRVVDGAVGARYLAALRQLLEAPALLLI